MNISEPLPSKPLRRKASALRRNVAQLCQKIRQLRKKSAANFAFGAQND